MDVAHRATFSGHRAGGKSGCAPRVPESHRLPSSTVRQSSASPAASVGVVGDARKQRSVWASLPPNFGAPSRGVANDLVIYGPVARAACYSLK